MKLIIQSFLVLVCTVQICFAQTNEGFDRSLTALTDSLVKKISSQKQLTIAVWDFTDLDGNVINIGKYVSEQVSVKLSNRTDKFQVMDRNNLQAILKEHKLNSEGYIDPNTAKQLGKFAEVDYVVTGKITVLSNQINLTMKMLNTETAMINGSVSGYIPMDDYIRDILGISSHNNRGFNGNSVNSNENYNNPGTVNKGCETKNTGDYCFQNNTNKELNVRFYKSEGEIRFDRTSTLQPGQSQCFYDVPIGPTDYNISDKNAPVYFQYPHPPVFSQRGSLYIEQCKSKTFTIK